MASTSARPKGVQLPGGDFLAQQFVAQIGQRVLTAAASFRSRHRSHELLGSLRRRPETDPASQTALLRSHLARAKAFPDLRRSRRIAAVLGPIASKRVVCRRSFESGRAGRRNDESLSRINEIDALE